MTTVTSNQGIIIQQGPDPANLPGAQVSQLSVEENRLVQRYTNEADRAARNPAPNENEYSALASEDRHEVYNGSTWISQHTRSLFKSVRRSTDAAPINACAACFGSVSGITTM